MNPAWPETIDSGHTQERLEDGRKTGLYQSRFAAGFWPGGWPEENSAPCWPCTLASLPRRADSAILEPCHFRMGPVAIVQSSKDLARLLCLFPFCTLHGWLLSCENVLDITDTKALACHRILCVDMLAEPAPCVLIRSLLNTWAAQQAAKMPRVSRV